jgi:type VI secretion system protein ImpE
MTSARARALYERGDLDAAIQALNEEVRDNPTDPSRRTFLFELLAFAGEWDRAEKQLDVLARDGENVEMGALVYRSALHAEKERDEMFSSGAYPQGDSGPPAVSGTLNGKPFKILEDADPRLGARLEVYAAGQYTWLPLEHVAAIRAEEPKRLRDLLWVPAQVIPGPRFEEMELGEVLIPALNPGSHRHPEGSVRLGRETRVEALDGGDESLYGPKLFLMDDDVVPLLDIRELVIDQPSDSAGADADQD